ncbi:MAG TPA: glycine betaine ABC transporter substrate-binding protein [Thermoanaerobaculia bacterium]|nr:glycine betaine ABC transporter substrate-binding protein [Thermoanaerobaculia bacterium]
MRRAGLLAAAVAAMLVVAACSRGQRPLRVGSKNFTEQVILGEIAAQSLEKAGLKVERRLNLGGTFLCHQALVSGELDLYPEYTGTALLAILKGKPESDPGTVFARVAAEYARRWNLVWAPPLGFENTFALVMRGDDAKRLGISRISDLAAHPDLRLGFGYEFVERADGFAGLSADYGLHFTTRPAEMDLGLLYPALEQGKVDVVAGNSTDGLIAAMRLAVLEDDRRYFPPYQAAFVVRGAAWKDPRVRRALEGLSRAISADAMRAMNAAVDRDGKRPEAVAAQFLAERRERGHP